MDPRLPLFRNEGTTSVGAGAKIEAGCSSKKPRRRTVQRGQMEGAEAASIRSPQLGH
jgi:hypothetical protein